MGAATEKTPGEQAVEIQRLIGDAQDRLTRAERALKMLVERLEALEGEKRAGRQ